MYGHGISREGSVIDLGVDLDIVDKSGAWYTYEGEQLGQGRENAKKFLVDNPEIMVEITDRVWRQVRPPEPEPESELEPESEPPVPGFTEADDQPISIGD